MGRRAYLDHAASAPMRPSALAAMLAAWEMVGNPHSLHASGRAVRRLLEDARESLAADLGAVPAEVIFTSGGTEANNLALLGALRGRRALEPGRARAVISGIEHPSVDRVRTSDPEVVDRLATSESGVVDLDDAQRRIDARTAVVSVMAVNNETGAIQPIGEIAALARSAGAWVHSDAVQALGQVPCSFREWGLDAMTVSAHKVGGPVGIGALVVGREASLAPIGFGGGQERALRSGTVPAALAAGFAAAAHEAVTRLTVESERLAGLRAALVSGLSRLAGVRVNGSGPVSPAILNATFAAVRADDLLLLLDRAGIDASTGSACSAGVHQPSEVLLAMGRSPAEASASLRFSFGPDTTLAEIEVLLEVLPSALDRARAAFG